MPALRDVAALGCPSHWLVRFGGEDALVNQDQLVRRRAGKQVLVHDLKVLVVSGYQVHLISAPLGPVDPHHLVLDAHGGRPHAGSALSKVVTRGTPGSTRRLVVAN